MNIFGWIEDIEETYKFLIENAKEENEKELEEIRNEEEKKLKKTLKKKQKFMDKTLENLSDLIKNKIYYFELDVKEEEERLRNLYNEKKDILSTEILKQIGFDF